MTIIKLCDTCCTTTPTNPNSFSNPCLQCPYFTSIQAQPNQGKQKLQSEDVRLQCYTKLSISFSTISQNRASSITAPKAKQSTIPLKFCLSLSSKVALLPGGDDKCPVGESERVCEWKLVEGLAAVGTSERKT